MAFSERFPTTTRSTCFNLSYADTWTRDTETEILTQALQRALFSSQATLAPSVGHKQVHASGSGYEPMIDNNTDKSQFRTANVVPCSGKIAKPSSKTTFIKTDAGNFMEMVQKATGNSQFSKSGTNKSAQPIVAKRNVVMKQKPRRVRVEPPVKVGVVQVGYLPTLDTSSHFLVVDLEMEAVKDQCPETMGMNSGYSDEGEGFDHSYLFEGLPIMDSWPEME